MGYLVVGLIFTLIVAVDAFQRYALTGWALVYVAGSAILWPFVTPLWLARRPLRAGERRVGGTFWHWTRYFVAIWTVGMVALSVASVGGAAGSVQVQNSAQAAGATLGLGIGAGVLCAVWFVPTLVLLVLGLVLRNDNIQEGPTGPLAEQR